MSRDPNRSPRRKLQRAFLKLLRTEIHPPEELLRRSGVSAEQLATWLRGRAFRKELHRIYRENAERLRFELEVGRLYAARRLNSLGERAFDQHVGRLACNNILHLNPVKKDVIEKKPKRKAEATAPANQALPIHPDLPPDEAERLVREMEGGE